MTYEADLSIFILDDETAFLRLFQAILEDLGITNVLTASNPRDALQIIRQKPFDLAILDYDLNDDQVTGVDIGAFIKQVKEHVPLIFITSHFNENVYQQCRKLLPISFMNKDLSHLKVLQAVDLALAHRKSNPLDLTNEYPKSRTPFLTSEKYLFKIGDNYRSFALEDISYFFAQDKLSYARIDSRDFPTSIQLKTIEKSLYPLFLRIHKSYIINKSKIEAINPKEQKMQIAGEELPIGYTYRKQLLKELNLLR